MNDWRGGRAVVILSGGPRSRFVYYADDVPEAAIREGYRPTSPARVVAIGEVYERTPGSPADLRDVVATVWTRSP